MNFLGGMFKKDQPIQAPVQQSKPSMFNGQKLKIKQTTQQSPSKPNSDILSPESDAYKQQQLNSQSLYQETPTPVEDPPVEQPVEEVRKKPKGFGFIKKTEEAPKVEEPQQLHSEVIYEMDRENLDVREPAKSVDEVQFETPPEPVQVVKPSVLSNFKKKTKEDKAVVQLDNSYQKSHQQLMEELNYFANETNERKADIYRKQQASERNIQNMLRRLGEITQQETQLSTEQQVCVEEEQFEKAEEIEQQLKQLQERVLAIEKGIKDQEMIYQQLQDEKENIRGEEYPYYQEIEQKLDEIERQQIKYTEDYRHETSNQIKKVQQQVEEENERVKIQQIHTEIDQKHLDEEEIHLNQIMDNQTKEHRIEYDSLSNKKTQLESEIEELMILLRDKQSELERVSEDLIDAKEKVQEVQQKFNQQLEKVHNKRQKLLDELSGLAQERAGIEKIENDGLRKQVDQKNKLEFLAEQLTQIREKKLELSKKANSVPEQCQFETDAIYKYSEAKKSTDQAQKELSVVQRHIDELNYKRNLLQIQLNEILSKKSHLSQKLPKMIDDKSALVANKNFKAAQAINEQIKDAQKQIQNYEEKVSEMQNQEGLIIKQVEQIEDDVLVKKDRFEKLKEVSDVCRYFLLNIRLQEVQQITYLDMSDIIFEVQQEMEQLYSNHKQLIEGTSQHDNEQIEQTSEPEFEIQQEQELVVDDQQLEQQDEPIPEQVIEQEPIVEQPIEEETEEQKQQNVEQLKQQIDDATIVIDNNEKQMIEFAENDQYDEAEELKIQTDELISQVQEWKSILKNKYNFDVECQQ